MTLDLDALARPSLEQLGEMLQEANLPALLPSLAWLTGDLNVLADMPRPDPSKVREEQAGLTPEQCRIIQDRALVVIAGIGTGKIALGAPLAGEALATAMRHCTGSTMSDDDVALMTEELAAGTGDLRAPQWTVSELAGSRTLEAVVIGAGMSGILAAHRLRQAGVDVTVLEAGDSIGGTWALNTYPGVRVDVANHLYSYSCAQRHDWPHHFSTGEELRRYFEDCAEQFGVAPLVRFGHRVSSLAFDATRCKWAVSFESAAGSGRIECDLVVSAVGQLNTPKMPDIDGLAEFAGPVFHSARWDHSVDLRGVRVAVVGAAASAAQLAPHVAETAASVDIYQRTPNWFVPVPHYHEPVSAGMQWCLAHLPGYAQWYRFWLFWRGSEGLLPACRVDEGWDDGGASVGAVNRELRDLLTLYLDYEYADRPDLRPLVQPSYPPAAKRLVLDNGSWARAVKRDNVTLVADAVSRVTRTGVVDSSGTERPVDVIVCATGFSASEFLVPMRVTGSGGRDLHDTWAGEPSAHLGIMVPGFPNLFVLYGPNTNIVVNGSIIYFSECEVMWMMSCLEQMLAAGARAVEPTAQAHSRWRRDIDEGNRAMVWGAPQVTSRVNSWYHGTSGRSAQNWPHGLVEYWRRTRAADPTELEFLP